MANKRDAEKIAADIERELTGGTDHRLVIKKYHPRHPLVASLFARSRVFSPGVSEGRLLLLGEILDAHEILEERLDIRESTARRNRQALVRLVIVATKGPRSGRMRITKHDLAAVRRFSVADLTRELLFDFKEKYVGGTKGNPGQVKRRAANSTINQARSVFSDTACELYELEGLSLPDLVGFKKGTKFKRTGKGRFRSPDGPVIRSIFDLWFSYVKRANSGDNSVRNEAIAMTLALHGGLRRSEAARVTAADLRFEPSGLSVTNTRDTVTKTGNEMIVPIKPFIVEFLQDIAPNDGGFLIEGNDNTREDRVFRNVARALRSVGLNDTRPYHMLRKLFGSWVALTEGLLAAQARLGHESPQITYSTYARIQMEEDILGLWRKNPLEK